MNGSLFHVHGWSSRPVSFGHWLYFPMVMTDTEAFRCGAVLRGFWEAGLFHLLLCSFCCLTALFPNDSLSFNSPAFVSRSYILASLRAMHERLGQSLVCDTRSLDCISFSFWQIGLRPLSLFWESRCFLTTIRIFKISHGVRCKKKIHSRCSTTNLPRLKHIGGETDFHNLFSGRLLKHSMKRPSAASKLLRENSAAQVTSESLSWKMRTEAPSAWDVDPQDRRPCDQVSYTTRNKGQKPFWKGCH